MMTAADRRRLRGQLLAGLDKAAAGQHEPACGDHFTDFQTLEGLLVRLMAPGKDHVQDAWAKMRPADVARWKAARSAMFAKVVGRLDRGMS